MKATHPAPGPPGKRPSWLRVLPGLILAATPTGCATSQVALWDGEGRWIGDPPATAARPQPVPGRDLPPPVEAAPPPPRVASLPASNASGSAPRTAQDGRRSRPVDKGVRRVSAVQDPPVRTPSVPPIPAPSTPPPASGTPATRPGTEATAGGPSGGEDAPIDPLPNTPTAPEPGTGTGPIRTLESRTPMDISLEPSDASDTPPAQPPPRGVYPIDLNTALRLADAENPDIGIARAGILEALAVRQGALVLLLPTLNAGANYHGHTGNLQRSSGTILSLSEQSLYGGGGARTLAAESLAIPAVNITSPITEAIYEPLAAQQQLIGARFNAAATANSVLLEVANLYLDLIAAQASLESLRHSEIQTVEIVKIVSNFAATGEGRKADAERAEASRTLRRAAVEQAEGDVAIASARLARRLSLDPSIQLRPLYGPLAPFTLVDPNAPLEALLETALRQRPEVGERSANVAQAQAKYREELARPWLPTLWLGYSGGGFGGGSNLVPPLMGNSGSRTDFDVRVFWTLQNFGYGNLNLQRRRRAQVGEAVAVQSRTINRIRREVAQALANVRAQGAQVDVARRALQTAEDGFHEDFNGQLGGAVRPIEVLNSLNLLASARLKLIREITEANQAQFELYVSLGTPPPLDPSGSTAPPSGPPPVANPLHAPFQVHF